MTEAIQVEELTKVFTAAKEPVLTEIRYRLILKRPEPSEKLQELTDLFFK